MSGSSDSNPSAVAVSSDFGSLRLGRTGQSVVGRLIRFWDSRNVKKNGEFMGITLLLLDAKDSAIHGFIPANRASYYRSDLKAGSIVKVDRFEVAKCGKTYKITEHEFVIRFVPSTRVCEVECGGPIIKVEKFMVRGFNQLQMVANTNVELPDVVGEIRSVQGSNLKNIAETERIVVRLLVEPNVIVYLSLWDEAASSFRGLLQEGDKSHAVMVVTTVNPKVFGGNLYLNSTAGTRFFFDKTLPEISCFLKSVGDQPGQDFSCVDTLDGIKKREVVSIGELNAYISNINEQAQDAEFVCKAKIVGVLEQNGWYFVACTACNKKLERTGTSFSCGRCDTADVTGVVRFRVELAVDDAKDCATFVVFDREMTRLTNHDASTLSLETGSNGMGDELPKCLEELMDREFSFQIRVSPFNFTQNHRTFTVSTMTEEDVKGDADDDKEEEVSDKDEASDTTTNKEAGPNRKRRRE